MRDAKSRYSDTPVSKIAPDMLFLRARRQLIEKFPFFGILALRLNQVFTERVPTTAVDLHGNILLNPKWVNHMTEQELVFEIGHEVMHIVQGVFTRYQPGFNRGIWNLAADQIIDTMLVDAGLQQSGISKEMVPNDIQELARLDKITEARYHNLMKECGKNPHGGNPGGAGGKPGTQNIRQCEAGTLIQGNSPEAEQFAKEWTEHIIQAKMSADAQAQANGRGNQLSIDDETIKALTRPQIKWQDYLRFLAADTFDRHRYSFKRISRRGLAVSSSLPILYPEPKTATFMLDSSGSMSSELLARGLNEAIGIIRQTGCAFIDVICHTTDVYAVDRLSENALRSFKVKRGGTDHREAFEVACGRSKKHKMKRSSLVVAFTDLETCFPEYAPPFPVIWLHPPESARHEIPWGQKLVLR
jgi:predicted metal-dependent peptidase